MDAKSIPPRASAADYQAHAQLGTFAIGAEFTGHAISTAESLLNTEDYVVVEVGFFGAPDAHLKLSFEDFSMRINGKKQLVQGQPFGVIFPSLKDPNWAPPPSADSKSKTSIASGAGTAGSTDLNSKPEPVKVPIEVERAMQMRVQKASLPGGDRTLPEAGLLFFQHRGKVESIHSIELFYNGPAGKATLVLQP